MEKNETYSYNENKASKEENENNKRGVSIMINKNI